MSGEPAGRAEGTRNIAQKTALVEHLHEMILGTLFLMSTDILSGSYHFPVFIKEGFGDEEV